MELKFPSHHTVSGAAWYSLTCPVVIIVLITWLSMSLRHYHASIYPFLLISSFQANHQVQFTCLGRGTSFPLRKGDIIPSSKSSVRKICPFSQSHLFYCSSFSPLLLSSFVLLKYYLLFNFVSFRFLNTKVCILFF
jgi:hypothetical protein